MEYFSESVEEVEKFVGYKIQNFIADIGGLLGLFMGCSLISIVEIFYFVLHSSYFTIAGGSKENKKSPLEVEVDEIKEDIRLKDEKIEELSKEIELLKNLIVNQDLKNKKSINRSQHIKVISLE